MVPTDRLPIKSDVMTGRDRAPIHNAALVHCNDSMSNTMIMRNNPAQKPSIPEHIQQKRFQNEIENMLVERLQAEAHSKESHEELVRDMGITDEQLLDELANLGITRSTLIALRMLPLVLVAWAENRVDENERDAILKEALEFGIVEGSDAHFLLSHWLHKLPTGESLDAWKRHMRILMKRMSPQSRQKLIKRTEYELETVARASGGHAWFGRVSTKERKMIDGLMLALKSEANP